MPTSHEDRIRQRIDLVDEHIRQENAHHLAGIMATFGSRASYHDEPWRDHREGLDGVREYYEELIAAVPDFGIEITRRHVAETTIIVEVTITGTQLGAWRGLPATGRRVNFPLCGIYTFDAEDKLASERIYYDRASVLHQLGVFHEPTTLAGRLMTGLMHPFTVARAAGRALLGQRTARTHTPPTPGS